MKIINETIVDANPTVWSAEIRSANGTTRAVVVKASDLATAQVGKTWSTVGDGSLWSMMRSLTVIYKTENIVVCEEVYDYSDNQRETKDVQIHFFRI
jgi:hypothetical protein